MKTSQALSGSSNSSLPARFQVGGERQPVYAFLRGKGFVMSKRSDKEWTWGDNMTLLIYGAGSMATIYSNKGNFKGPLEETVNAALKGGE